MEEPKLTTLVDQEGNTISPQLADGVKNYLIDIDGTVTEDVPNEEPERMSTCEPFPDALATLNKWFDEGHIITFFTSRTEEHREVTTEWLDRHGFKYHGLLMNKPR
ncbi:MAG: phosphoheptose isomerase, partial [Bacteroidota bacterium]